MSTLDASVTIRDMLTLIALVRDEDPRKPLRRLEDVLLDLHAKASASGVHRPEAHERKAGRWGHVKSRDAEPRRRAS